MDSDYVIRVLNSPLEVDAQAWNALLATQADANPFMRHEYLAALHTTGAAIASTGWTPRFITLWLGDTLKAACPLYIKAHSYGEYVFDWAWANAYQRHGLDYYPKAVIAVPFTPVPGARLLAGTQAERALLIKAVVAWCEAQKLSSVHVLFGNDDDLSACNSARLMQRHTVQFHWTNVAPTLPAACGSLPPEGANFSRGGPSENSTPTLPTACGSLPPEGANFSRGGPSENSTPTLPASRGSLPPEGANFSRGGPSENCLGRSTIGFASFDAFLATLAQEKRKKIRQERRKVAEAGVTFRWSRGAGISNADWDFFYRCYERTYLEHGNAPYLSRDFFRAMQATLPEHWLLFVAMQGGSPIATSLIAIDGHFTRLDASKSLRIPENGEIGADQPQIGYGRYWGALKRVDCLHFEACYYQPLQWCIEHGFARFEGGAQGEHKMARALMPVKTHSAHWLAHPAFADAVGNFLQREGAGIENYLGELADRSPFKHTAADQAGPPQAHLPQ